MNDGPANATNAIGRSGSTASAGRINLANEYQPTAVRIAIAGIDGRMGRALVSSAGADFAIAGGSERAGSPALGAAPGGWTVSDSAEEAAQSADVWIDFTTPDATLAALDAELDVARQLRLARDRWALRRPTLRRFRRATARGARLAVPVRRGKVARARRPSFRGSPGWLPISCS